MENGHQPFCNSQTVTDSGCGDLLCALDSHDHCGVKARDGAAKGRTVVTADGWQSTVFGFKISVRSPSVLGR